jgi:DNA/RNA endonuclease G (NUC1)
MHLTKLVAIVKSKPTHFIEYSLLYLLIAILPCSAQVNDPLLQVKIGIDSSSLYLSTHTENGRIAKPDKPSDIKKTKALFTDTTMCNELKTILIQLHGNNVRMTREPLRLEDITLVKHHAYVSAMHNIYHIPAWVAHTITAHKIMHSDSTAKREGLSYKKDTAYPILKSNLYEGSGYDHGHLAPARDFKDNAQDYRESFYMTNMTPQHGCLNQKGWCFLESLCRTWACQDTSAIAYVITGPLLVKVNNLSPFIDSLCVGRQPKVYVPRYFFKAICLYNPITHKADCIAFLMPNQDTDDPHLYTHQLSIDDLEYITGMDFFAALPDILETNTEAHIGNFNFEYPSDCSNKPCTAVYNRRKLPEQREKCRCK